MHLSLSIKLALASFVACAASVSPMLSVESTYQNPKGTATPSGSFDLEYPIAFVSSRDGNANIYTMHADGSEVIQLTNNQADDYDPSWSPDGKTIAFTSRRDGNNEIYIIDLESHVEHRLTNNSVFDILPNWFIDGSKIAFTSFREGNDGIYTLNVNSPKENATFLVDGGGSVWSPDGKLIAFLSEKNAECNDIYVINSGDMKIHRLTTMKGCKSLPSWSPNGKYLTFAASSSDGITIYTINAAGSDLTKIVSDGNAPSWSPSGTAIVFQSFNINRNEETDIFVFDLITKTKTQLTSDGVSVSPEWLGRKTT